MKIKLLHAVLHDGYRVEAGEVGDIDEAIATPLIASGAAVAVVEPDKTAGNASPAETAPAAASSATPETPPTENAEAAPVAEDTQAEPGKAAKTKGSK